MKVLPAALKLEEISLIRDGSQILNEVNLEVLPNEKWVILGPNGSGKTSLLKIAGLYLHPSSGKVSILGNDLGKSDIRKIRHLVGFTSASLADLLRPSLLTRDVVKTAKFGALEPWWNSYDKNDEDLALHQLERLGILGLADQKFGSLSSGEKQRTLIARSLMSNPKILLLDEPASGLDLPGREDLLQSLTLLASDPFSPPVVMVTHHVEEIPEADKLYKLKIDLGTETRDLVAGLKQHYTKTELEGKRVIVFTNLEPKKLKGIESQGMVLAAVNDDHSEIKLLQVDGVVPLGSKVS